MSDYRIESITLKDVGVFDDVHIDFPKIESAEADEKKAEIHLFTGPNGSGKSTLLYGLAGMFSDNKSANIYRRFHNTSSSVMACFFGGNYKYPYKPINYEELIKETQGLRINNRDDFYISPIDDYSALAGNYKQVVNSQVVFRFAVFAYSGRRTLNQVSVHNVVEIADSPFESALAFEGDTASTTMAQWVLNTLSSEALARMNGQEPVKYRSALNHIEAFIEDICQFKLKFRVDLSPLNVRVQIGNDVLSFDVLPDGLKSIISWVADLARRLDSIPWAEQRDIFSQNIILFLDEIDIHLHPKWQRRILPAVQKLLPNAQIFASTHSPFVVGSVEDAWVYKLPEKGQQTERMIRPVKSSPAKSYALILEEVFGVDKGFGLEVESLLNEFYQYRNFFLKDKTERDNLIRVVKELLTKNSEEINAIIGRELRQIKRLTNEELVLA